MLSLVWPENYKVGDSLVLSSPSKWRHLDTLRRDHTFGLTSDYLIFHHLVLSQPPNPPSGRYGIIWPFVICPKCPKLVYVNILTKGFPNTIKPPSAVAGVWTGITSCAFLFFCSTKEKEKTGKCYWTVHMLASTGRRRCTEHHPALLRSQCTAVFFLSQINIAFASNLRKKMPSGRCGRGLGGWRPFPSSVD